MTETTFTLVPTNKSRGGGDDDYDVYDGDKVIGRIVRHAQAPMEAPWFWVISSEGLSPSWLTDRGYAVSREHAFSATVRVRQRKDLDIFSSPRSTSRPGHNGIAGGTGWL